MTKKDPDTLVREGLAADRLLADPTFTDVSASLVEEAASAWMREQDRDKREALWLRVQAVAELTTALRIRSDRGKAAKAGR